MKEAKEIDEKSAKPSKNMEDTDFMQFEPYSGKDREQRFKDYDDARQRISEFVQFYNESRPHGSIGYKVPSQAHQETGIQRCMWR